MLDKLRTLLVPLIFCSLTVIAFEYYLQYKANSIANSEVMDDGLLLHDKELGWKLQKNWKGEHSHLDFDVSYQTNNQGFRTALSRYNANNQVIVLGDSFTFGIGVNSSDTFISQYNSHSSTNRNQPTLINYGVPGYSTDQEYLLLKKLQTSNLAVNNVLLVVYLGNDLIDNQYPYPIQADYGKPYFKLSNNNLQLQNSPVPLRQKTADYRHKTLATEVLGAESKDTLSSSLNKFEIGRRVAALIASDSTKIDQALAINAEPSLLLFREVVSALQQQIEDAGGKLTIALLPSQAYVVNQKSIPARYQSFIKEQIKKTHHGITVIDLAEPLRTHFETTGTALFHTNEGHLNKKGHQVVADTLRTQFIY